MKQNRVFCVHKNTVAYSLGKMNHRRYFLKQKDSKKIIEAIEGIYWQTQ